jgi:hypothetical protein
MNNLLLDWRNYTDVDLVKDLFLSISINVLVYTSCEVWVYSRGLVWVYFVDVFIIPTGEFNFSSNGELVDAWP